MQDSSNDHCEEPTSSKNRSKSILAIITNSIGMLTNGYLAGLLSFVLLILLKIHGPDVVNGPIQDAFTYAPTIGYLIGQFGFGKLIDIIGRRIGLIAVVCIILVGSIMMTAANGTTPSGLMWMVMISRSIIGLGLGGEFPCSATSSSELISGINVKRRGMALLWSLYLMVEFGTTGAGIVTVAILAIFRENLEATWRLLCALPIISSAFLLYYRVKYMKDMTYEGNISNERKVPASIIIRRYWFVVLIPSVLWVLYDFVYFPSSMFSGVILDRVAKDAPLMKTSAWNILINAFYVPGMLVSGILVDIIGRRWTVIVGLTGQALIGFILGIWYQQLVDYSFPLFVVLYGIMLGLGEVYGYVGSICVLESTPQHIRGTAYGIAAGSGKIGGVAGSASHSALVNRFGLTGAFVTIGITASIAALIAAFFLQETKGERIMEKCDEEYERYLVQCGFSGRLKDTQGDEET